MSEKEEEVFTTPLIYLMLQIDFQPRGWLFLPKDAKAWTMMSPACVLQLLETAPDEDESLGIPEFAKKHNMRCTLERDTVEDIVFNLREQKKDASPEEVFKAFMYYWKNDAFIDMSK